jgi:Ca2+:H+ antiporter
VLSCLTRILVDVVDSNFDGTGLDEKLFGVVLFAIVPNATEFLIACSFALNGNIALLFVCFCFFTL